jgi:hypothetical protein
MIEHKYHGPAVPFEIKPSSTGRICPFCFSSTLKNCYCSSCGTWIPSPLAERSPHSLRSKNRLRKQTVYTPRVDGLLPTQQDVVKDQEHDELSEYADELEALDIHIDEDQDTDPAEDLPTSQELEELPWN